MTSNPIRPSRRWYLVAGALLAATIACIALSEADLISDIRQAQQLQRFTVPGEAEVTFSEPGQYYLYLEGPVIPQDSTAAASVLLQPANGGPPVSIDPPAYEYSYTMGGHNGQLLGTFRIDQPGAYRLSVDEPTPGVTHVAVGGNITSVAFIALLVASIPLALAGLTAGVTTAVLRKDARRRRHDGADL